MKRSVLFLGLLFMALSLANSSQARGAPPIPAPASEQEITAGVTPIPNVRVRFEGPIQSLGSGVSAIWMVAGIQVQVDAATVIAPVGVEPQVGDRALVRALYTPEGTMKAFHISVTKAAQYQPELVEFYGPIQAPLPVEQIGQWIVNGIRVQIIATTTLLPAGVQPKVGDVAHVQAWRQVDGSLIAQTVRVEPVVPGRVRVQFEGPIEQCPADAPYLGNWTIAGVQVRVADAQAIIGRPTRGLIAEVDGLSEPDTLVLAERIRILEPNVAFVDIEGAIQTLPAGSLLGRWVVGGQQLVVTASTLVDETRVPARLGQWAVVRAQQRPGEPPEALRIRIERAREDAPAVEFSGLIQELPSSGRIGTWRVGEVAVEVTRQTRISGVPTAGQGALARIAGTQMPNGQIRAISINVSYPWASAVTYEGAITLIPGGFFGPWHLSGQTDAKALITPWASITGTPRPGAHVTVRGVWLPGADVTLASNHVLAFEVEVEGESATTQVVGSVRSAAGWPLGVWQVGTATVYVHAGTEFAGNPAEGSLVAVTGVVLPTGQENTGDQPRILAQRIEELDETRR